MGLELAEAHHGEIIGADSVQVYRWFDVGSSKPTADERARVPHHLVDVADPDAPLDAASYAELADKAIADVRSRGKLPIVCGGTYLWVRALLYGLAKAPPGDAAIRMRLSAWAEAEGRAALHNRLTEVDPVTAARLSPNDFVRVSRALEVFELSGKPISAWQAEHGFRERRFQAKVLGLRMSNEALLERISKRTEQLLALGFIDEVHDLVARGYRNTRAMSSVGYRQVLEFIDGKLSRDDLAPAIDRATKIFARRQRTWLRDEAIIWIER